MTSGELPYGDPTIETAQVWIYALGPDSVARESDLDLREEMELARQGQLPTGKWLIFVAPNEIAEIWNSVAAAVVAGKLGDAAKVSTAAQDRDLQKDFVICVYSPWADEDTVRRHLTVLRSLGIEGRLSYKRDNETWVRSRGGNAWYWSPDGEELLLTRYAKEWKPTTREEAAP
jgi:hypothetical protein